MAVFETVLQSDLKKPVQVKQLIGNLFSADNGGNKITVEVLDNGSAATLSGGVTGYVIRGDNATVAVTGTLTNNRASIVLPAAAYVVVGHISIVIKVGTTTVGACTGYVYRTTTDTIVDPGHVIPSIEELLAQISACEAATTAATNAATLANTKAGLADEKATLANTKAALADEKATLANTKAGLADEKATLANTAAGTANAAATKINDMTVAASGLSAGSAPTATVSEVSGHKHIAFGIPKGEKGDTGNPGKDFHIAFTFASIALMEAYSGEIDLYDYAMIDTGSVQDADTGKLFCWEDDTSGIDGTGWHYIGDLSGAQGIKGETGDSAYLHIRYASAQPSADSDMKTTFDAWIGLYTDNSATASTHYTDYAWYKLKGETGSTGATPNISIGTVTTLNAGSQATASMTGTPEAPVLNLGIPRGADATISSQTTYYATNSSPTTPPASDNDWGTTIPTVTQGDYLWYKHVITWSDNSTSTIISRNREGVDGNGSIVSLSVDGVTLSPNSSGVVTIPVDSSPTSLSHNLMTSGDIYTQIAGLSARIDQLDPEQGSAIFTDLDLTIAANAWTLTNGVYKYTYSNVLITAASGIEVFYNSSLRTAITGDIYVDKNTGSVDFYTTKAPIGTLTAMLRVIVSVSGTLPVAKGGTGAVTAKGARQNLNVSIKPIVVDFGTVSSLPQTSYDADITAEMTAMKWEFGDPTACPKGITITLADGSVTISLDSSQTFTGSSTIKVWLVNPRTVADNGTGQNQDQYAGDYVQIGAQTLTSAQKTQVLTNIGGVSADDIGTVPSGKTVEGQITELNSNLASKVDASNFDFSVTLTKLSIFSNSSHSVFAIRGYYKTDTDNDSYIQTFFNSNDKKCTLVRKIGSSGTETTLATWTGA